MPVKKSKIQISNVQSLVTDNFENMDTENTESSENTLKDTETAEEAPVSHNYQFQLLPIESDISFTTTPPSSDGGATGWLSTFELNSSLLTLCFLQKREESWSLNRKVNQSKNRSRSQLCRRRDECILT